MPPTPRTPPDAEARMLPSFPELRSRAYADPLITLCVHRRTLEITTLLWDVTARDGHALTPAQLPALRTLFARPNPSGPLGEWLTSLIRDTLTIDATAVQILRGPTQDSVLGSGVLGLGLLDGARITPRPDPSGTDAGTRTYHTLPVPRLTVTRMTDPAQRGGRALRTLREGQDVLYRVMNPRPGTPFGCPPVERLPPGYRPQDVLSAFGLSERELTGGVPDPDLLRRRRDPLARWLRTEVFDHLITRVLDIPGARFLWRDPADRTRELP